MIFTIGDLIVLGGVILILFAFRRLDKNSKTLEKVRRYAEKASGELDKLVEEKRARLKDLVDDVDVQERTGREVLKRIITNNEELLLHEEKVREKLVVVESLQERMDQLNDMTVLVDGNMKKVADESAYVDSVGSRLKESRIAVEEISRRLDGIHEDFDRANREKLEVVKSSVMEDYQTRLNIISEQLRDSSSEIDGFRMELSSTLKTHEEEKEGRLREFAEEVARLEGDYRTMLATAADRASLLGDEVFTALQEDIEQKSDRLEKNWFEGMNDLKAQVAEQVESIRGEMEDGRDRIGQFNSEVERLSEEFEGRIGEQKEEVRGTVEGVEKLLEEYSRKARSDRSELDEKRESFDREQEEFRVRMDRALEDMRGELAQRMTDVKALVEEKSLVAERESMKVVEERYAEYARKSEEDRRNIAERQENFASEQEAYQERMDNSLGEIQSRLDQRLNEIGALVEERSKAVELESMKAVEQRYADYDEVIRQRYERLDSFTKDMADLETSLRDTLEGLETRQREQMEQFASEMEEGRNREKERNEGRLTEIHVMIGEIEKELNQLKRQAYDRVSENLQLFEDDFFTDLKKREGAMQESFTEWRRNVEVQLEDIGGNALRDREEVERNGMAQMNRRMSELQTRVVDQFEKFQEQVRTFQGNINEQIEAGETNIAEYRRNAKDELERNRTDAMAYLAGESESLTALMDGRLDDLRKSMDGQLEQMAAEAEAGRSELTALVERARTDGDMWQNRLTQQIRENEIRLENELNEFNQSVAETVADLKNTFAAQKDELVISSNKDRVEVRRDIADLFERIAALNNDLTGKSEQTLELFNEKSEQYLIDYQQRFREALNDSDEKIKLMRSSLTDTKEKMDGYQHSLHNRIEESYRDLLANVEKIEEKQQDFINQTRIFEQADALRNSLEGDIVQLQNQIREVERSREDLGSVREECARVLKIYDSVTDKTDAFLSEQQKIDLLDGKVARIINLSDAIDMKLDHVSETDETMQGYMVKLHQMEDLHREIARRYKDLEKKSSVVDATTQSVDRNFEMLTRIEEGLSGINEDLVPLRGSLQEVKRNSETLLENKDQVDTIINSMSNLDTVIGDLDGRMKKMEKAREWLAGTETRLENISKEAQEKVKLLGNLASRDGRKSTARATGSPDMNTREMVIQLARQGWSSEEISRYVKLSRGEVELILELSPPGSEE
jgi:chromosome segregation ATPase